MAKSSPLSPSGSLAKLLLCTLLIVVSTGQQTSFDDYFQHVVLQGKQAHRKPLLRDYLNTTIKYDHDQIEQAMNYGHAFLRGLESTSFAQNITKCYDSWLQFYYIELMELEIAYYYADTDDAVFNTTHIIGKIGEHSLLCTAFFQGFYNFYYDQKDSYRDTAAFFISFFQNLLANVLNINTIYQAMEAAISKTGNITDVYYQAGKIVRIVLDITPVIAMEDMVEIDDYSLPSSHSTHNTIKKRPSHDDTSRRL